MGSTRAGAREAMSTRDVVDAMARAVIVTDPSGRIALWSSGAQALYGWTEEDVLGRPTVEVIIPAVDRAESTARLAEVIAGGASQGDRLVLRRDGTTMHAFFSSHPVVGADGTVLGVVSVSEDVTEVRRAEQSERELTQHLQLALEAASLGTWRWDMATGMNHWDERLEALFGLPPGGFDGTYDAWVALLHPDDRDAVLAQVQHAIATRSAYRLEHRALWPDGSVRWLVGRGRVTVDGTGEPTGTIGCVMDVTEGVEQQRRQELAAEEAIARAEQERIHRERLEFLNEVNAVLASSVDRQEIMANTVWAAVPRLGDWCVIHVLPEDGGAPDVEVAHVDPAMVTYARSLLDQFPSDPEAERGVAQVIRTGVHQFHPDITEEQIEAADTPPAARAVVRELELRSAITVPLTKRGRVLGALQLVMSGSRRRYTEDDLSLAWAVAGRVAASLENRRLSERQRRIAETFQASLLPDRLPAIDGIELAVRYWAAGEADEVGGDFYDVFRVDDRTWGAVVGDICGKGPDAAALTGLARHSIRMSAWNGNGPEDTIRWLNRAVHEAATGSFLTAAYLTMEPDGAGGFTVTLASGGHPHPMLATADGRVEAIEARGTLLGPFESIRCEPVVRTMGPGDTLVLYTDGVTDLPPPHALDDARLADLVAEAARHGDAEQVAEHLHDAIEAILPIDRRDDDIAVLVIHATG